MKRRGVFITLEGGEGCGKSTQLSLVAKLLEKQGVPFITTREPGGSAGGELLRNTILFSDVAFSARSEVLLHMAARADHVDQIIRPACEAGKLVLCDRYHHSTIAYQGYGADDGAADLLKFIEDARRLIAFEPDKTFLFNVPPKVAAQRLARRKGRTDRYEERGAAFHDRVRQGFDKIQKQEPERIEPIDAAGDADALSRILFRKIMALREGAAQ
ncbi:MAG: dTMP kinase [Acetobacteraceae bacterium]